MLQVSRAVQSQTVIVKLGEENSFNYFFFHSCAVHLDVIKVFYLPTDAQQSCFKRILKFILKQLLHVSV